MGVFISSVVGGLELERELCAAAIEAAGLKVDRSEAIGAKPEAPRRACLSAVSSADAIVALFDRRFGYVPTEDNPERLSGTALEVETARKLGKPVFVFIRGDAKDVEPDLAVYLKKLKDFERGLFVVTFRDPGELRRGITNALRQHRPSLGGQPESARRPTGNISAMNTGAGVAVAVGSGNVNIGSYNAHQSAPTSAEWVELSVALRDATARAQGYFQGLGIATRGDSMASAATAVQEVIAEGAAGRAIEPKVASAPAPLKRDMLYLANQLAIGVTGNAAYAALMDVLHRFLP